MDTLNPLILFSVLYVCYVTTLDMPELGIIGSNRFNRANRIELNRVFYLHHILI